MRLWVHLAEVGAPRSQDRGGQWAAVQDAGPVGSVCGDRKLPHLQPQLVLQQSHMWMMPLTCASHPGGAQRSTGAWSGPWVRIHRVQEGPQTIPRVTLVGACDVLWISVNGIYFKNSGHLFVLIPST